MTNNISRRGLMKTAAAGGAFSLLPRIASAADPIVLKFSHVVTNDTPKGKGALRFKELAEKYTAGKVKVEVYPNSSLYKDKEELEALQLGTVQILAPATSKFAPLGVKEFEALDLPYVFKNDADYNIATKGEVGKFLLAKLTSKNIRGLAFWDNGFHMMSANKPLHNSADFEGLKVRIDGSKIAGHYFHLLGCIPQIIAFSEVYQALQTGVVDGTQNTPSNYLTQKFYEVQKHITVSNHAHLQYAVIVNDKYWGSLPADIRAGLDKAMAEATMYSNSIAQKENAVALETMKKSGKCTFYDITPAQTKDWASKMAPTYKWAVARVGQPVLDLLAKPRG